MSLSFSALPAIDCPSRPSTPSPSHLPVDMAALTVQLPPLSFQDLPDEILSSIAWELTPDGGRKAGALRLVCPRLGSILAHVVWAAIDTPRCRDQPNRHAKRLALLAKHRSSAVFTKSLRYRFPTAPVGDGFRLLSLVLCTHTFPNLKELYIWPDDDDDALSFHLHPIVLASVGQFAALTTLHLHLVRLPESSDFSIANSLPTVRRLCLDRCQTIESILDGKPFLVILTINAPSPAARTQRSNADAGRLLRAVIECLPTLKDIDLLSFSHEILTAQIPMASHSSSCPNLLAYVSLQLPAHLKLPLRVLRLLGLPSLFNPREGQDQFNIATVRFLSLFKLADLSSLSLSLTDDFNVHAEFFSLRMPNLQTLELLSRPASEVDILDEVCQQEHRTKSLTRLD